MTRVSAAPLVVGAALTLLLSACVGSDPAPTPTRSSSPTPTASEPPRALTIECEGVKAKLDEFPPIAQISEVPSAPVAVGMGNEAVVQAGGLACAWNGSGLVTVTALPDAAADFAEARASAETTMGNPATPWYVPHLDSEVGDEGFRSCADFGGGEGFCQWSALAGDTWVNVSISGALDLEVPGADANGYAQMPFPVEGSALEGAVDATVRAIAASRSGDAPARVPVDEQLCLARLTPDTVAQMLGVRAANVTVDVDPTAEQQAALVASSPGYALPTYAAERSGWSACSATVADTTIELTVVPKGTTVFRPGSVQGADTVAESTGEYGYLYRLATFDGDTVRSATVVGMNPSFPDTATAQKQLGLLVN